MITPKRISLVLAITIVVSLLVILAATYQVEGTSATTQPLRSRILRRHDRTKEKPNATELESLRKQAQEVKQEERELEDKIPSHLPIKVKIRDERQRAFKDLDNPHWAGDFELEVKNMGTKPIYRLGLLLLLPETQIDGGRLLFSLHYGRTELSVFKEKLELAKPEDVPIDPGKTYIFKIPEGQVAGWEDSVKTEGWPQPKKIVLRFEQLSFGDGTGFRWGEGVPWPESRKKTAACLQASGAVTRVAKGPMRLWPNNNSHNRVSKFSLGGMPASYLPAKFLYAPSLLFLGSMKSAPEPDDSCCPSGCSWVHEYEDTTTCYGSDCDSIHRADYCIL